MDLVAVISPIQPSGGMKGEENLKKRGILTYEWHWEELEGETGNPGKRLEWRDQDETWWIE